MEVVRQDDDRGSAVGSADAEVQYFIAVAEGCFPADVDGVVACRRREGTNNTRP